MDDDDDCCHSSKGKREKKEKQEARRLAKERKRRSFDNRSMYIDCPTSKSDKSRTPFVSRYLTIDFIERASRMSLFHIRSSSNQSGNPTSSSGSSTAVTFTLSFLSPIDSCHIQMRTDAVPANLLRCIHFRQRFKCLLNASSADKHSLRDIIIIMLFCQIRTNAFDCNAKSENERRRQVLLSSGYPID